MDFRTTTIKTLLGEEVKVTHKSESGKITKDPADFIKHLTKHHASKGHLEMDPHSGEVMTKHIGGMPLKNVAHAFGTTEAQIAHHIKNHLEKHNDEENHVRVDGNRVHIYQPNDAL